MTGVARCNNCVYIGQSNAASFDTQVTATMIASYLHPQAQTRSSKDSPQTLQWARSAQ